MSNRLVIPNITFIGKSALADATNDICSLGKSAFIVTGQSMMKQGHIKTLKDILHQNNIETTIFTQVTSEPTDTMINEGKILYLNNKCDFIIGFGGGSQLDAAKAIGMLVTNKGNISDYCGASSLNPIPPLAAIPSTAGTGSEATNVTIVTDTQTNVKMLIKNDVLMPKLAIIDPIFTVRTPRSVTVSTGLDALTHAIEAYTSKKAFPQSDIFALSAIKRIFEFLPKILENSSDMTFREQMAMAAYEAGISFNNSSVTVVHGMSRPIGALFHVPHGMSNAMLLEKCLKYVVDGNYTKFAKLGRHIGATSSSNDKEAADAFITAVSHLCRSCNVPTLSEYGINKNEFLIAVDKMSDDAIASGSPANTCKPLIKDDLIKIYKSLWI